MINDEKYSEEESMPRLPNEIHEAPVLLSFTAIESGISLFSTEFQSDMANDQVLLSVFLSTLRLMSDMMFQLPFDEMRFGDYALLMRVKFPFLISYIFRGSISKAKRKLDEFIGHLEEYPSILDSFENTIGTGEIDKIARSFVEDLAAQVFTKSENIL